MLLSEARELMARVWASYPLRGSREPSDEEIASALHHVPEFCSEPWRPFPDDTREPVRRIWLMNCDAQIGTGAYGIVFPVALQTEGSSEREPRVVLAAMKMLPILKYHGRELVNTLASNDLVRSGCTPGVARLLDAFCITETAKITRCQMPPKSWNSCFWKHYDTFVYNRMSALEKTYGSDIWRGPPDHTARVARVNAGAPLGFIFTELSLAFLWQKQKPPSKSGEVTVDNERHRDAMAGVFDTCTLMSQIYQRLQTLDALHASHMLHCDIHPGNWLFSPSIASRTSHCQLDTVQGCAIRDVVLGRAGVDRADDRLLHRPDQYLYRFSDKEECTIVLATPVDRGIAFLIDMGASRRALSPSGGMTQSDLIRYLFSRSDSENGSRRGSPLTDSAPRNGEAPFPIPNILTMSMSHTCRYKREIAPAFTIISSPTTEIRGRCPEQLNPWVIPNVVARSEFAARTHYLAFHSEYSDIYSQAADLATLILGFNIFGNHVHASLNSSSASSYTRSRGIRLTSHINSLRPGDVLRASTNTTVYTLAYSFFETRAERVSSSMAPLPDVFVCDLKYDPAPLVAYLEMFTRQQASTAMGDAACPMSHCSFLGETQDELRDACTALLKRIDAVGLPSNVHALRGTVFYDYFLTLKCTSSERKRGWLFHALCETLERKWLLEPGIARNLAHRICDALSLDPSDRPSLQTMMRIGAISQYLRHYALVPNIHTLWSSLRATRQNSIPLLYLRGGNEVSDFERQVNFVLDDQPIQECASLFSRDLSDVRQNFGLLHWAFTAIEHVAKLRILRTSYYRTPGFLLQYEHLVPRLHSSESGVAAVYNYLTGALDYFNGAVCVKMGINKEMTAERYIPTLNAHFKSKETAETYVRWLNTFLRRFGDQIDTFLPGWIFAEAHDVLPVESMPDHVTKKIRL